ncbi:MAG: YIP1 family protein [Halodesulfovibrio sp.]
MIIRCPECLFERQVDLSKIPPTAQLATCPKCRFKFRFREYVVDIPDVVSPVERMEVKDSPYVHPALRDSEEQTATAQDHGEHHGEDHGGHARYATPEPEETRSAYGRVAPGAYDEPETAPEVSPEVAPNVAPGIAPEPDNTPEEQEVYAAAEEVEYVVRRSAVSPAAAQAEAYDAVSHEYEAPDADDTSAISDADDAEDAVTATEMAQTEYAPRAAQNDDYEDAAGYDEETVYTVIRPQDDAEMQQAGAVYDEHEAADALEEPEETYEPAAASRVASTSQAASAASKPHRHLGTISDFDDHGGKGDIWDAIAAMGDGDQSGVSAFIRHSSVEMQIPWENRGKLGLFAAWRQTLGQALFSPSRFFGCIQGAGGFAAPFLFFFFTTLLAVGLETGSLAILYSLWGDSLNEAGLALPAVSAEGIALGSMALGLFGYAFGRLMVMTLVCHLLLRLSFSRCKSFATTFRVMAYSSAASLVGVLPLVGTIGAQLWFLSLAIVGLRQAHEADWKQTMLAVLPVCMLILVAVFWLVGVGSGTGV